MIKTVSSNLKGTRPQDFQSAYVLLLGKNGAGKSRLAHSIELALCGQAVDMAGKDVKLKRRLVQMVAGEEPVKDVEVAVEMNDGRYYEYGKQRFYRYRNVVKECMDAMTGSGDAFYRFLLQNSSDDWPVKLDYPKWDALVTRHGSYRMGLLKMEETLRKSVTSHRSKLKELDIVLKYHRTDDLVTDREVASNDLKSAQGLLKQVQDRIRSFGRRVADVVEKKAYRWMPVKARRLRIVDMPDGDVCVCFDADLVPSGAETVILAMALGAVLFDPDYSLFILPDKAYDSVTLARIMRVARTLPVGAGVFIQSTIEPDSAEYSPTDMGWDVVKVGHNYSDLQ